MKKMAEIMEELGFKPNASDDVKKAFIKNLIKQAQATEFSRDPIVKKENEGLNSNPSDDVDKYEQISLFDQKKSS